jgi:hypothetical protein
VILNDLLFQQQLHESASMSQHTSHVLQKSNMAAMPKLFIFHCDGGEK